MTGEPVRTVFLGSGGFGVESLRRLRTHPDIDLVGVVSAPPRPAGRQLVLMPTAIHAAADDLEVATILTPERLRDPGSVDTVLALGPDLLVLADYGQIVPPALLELEHGALNLHPSLLPRHRGATPIPAAILAGDVETGVTLMRMDAGLDTGPIVAQERLSLDGRETTPTLEATLQDVAAGLLDRSLGPWIRGDLLAVVQSEAGATLTRPLRRVDGQLDPGHAALDLWRQVRAYQPWPGSFVDTALGRIVVLEASVGRVADPVAGRIGTEGLETAEGILHLHSVRPAGGRPMPWSDYLRGHPTIAGSQILVAG